MLYTGVDIIEIARIQRAFERQGQRFAQRIFTAQELLDCNASFAQGRMQALSSSTYASLAARWAAKEATAKALDLGLQGLPGNVAIERYPLRVAWTAIEVQRDPSGRPALRLHDQAAERKFELGIQTLSLSLSHARTVAIAMVVGL